MKESQEEHKPETEGTRHVWRIHVFDIALGKDIVLEIEDVDGIWDDLELFRRLDERQGRG